MTPLRAALAVAALGGGLTALGLWRQPVLAGSSVLLAFAYWASAAMGAVLLVALLNATGAVWPTLLRRRLEHLGAALVPCASAFVALALDLGRVYGWAAAPGAERRAWLSEPGWVTRGAAVLGLFVGLWLAFDLRTRAQEQRSGPRPELKARTRTVSAVAAPLLALGLMLAGVDWLMTLEPGFGSAAFGAYFGCGAVCAALALLTLWAVGAPAVSSAHLEALGRLLVLACCAWGLLALSQAVVLGGARLPADEAWLAARQGRWRPVGALLLAGHFALPLAALAGGRARQSRKVLTGAAVWLLAMHFVDLVYVIKPALRLRGEAWSAPGQTLGFTDLAAFAALGGLCAAFVSLRAGGRAPLPMNDPALEASLAWRPPSQ